MALPPDLSGAYVHAICPRRAGGVWVGTDGGLLHLQSEQYEPYTNYPAYELDFVGWQGPVHQNIRSLYEDPDGDLWVGDYRGLVRMRSGTKNFELFYQSGSGVGSMGNSVARLIPDSRGGFWFGTDRGLFHYPNASEATLTITNRPMRVDGFKSYPRKLLGLESPVRPVAWWEGTLWIANGKRGLCRWHRGELVTPFDSEGEFTLYPGPTGLSDDEMKCALRDREGNLWLGTWNGGLNRLPPARVVTFSMQDGLPSNNVRSLTVSPDGRMWVATDKGISFRSGDAFLRAAGLESASISSELADHEGGLWLGHPNLCHFQSHQLEQAYVESEGKKVPVQGFQVLYEDLSGDVWAGAEDLFRFRHGQGTLIPILSALAPPDRPRSLSITSILQDAKGAVWIGTRSGVCRISEGEINWFTPQKGFPAQAAGPALADADGTVWFFSNKGLIRFRDGRFSLLSQVDGLFEDTVYSVLDDDLDGCGCPGTSSCSV